MFDLKDLQENFERYEKGWQHRQAKEALEIAKSLKVSLKNRKELIKAYEDLLSQRNQAAQEIAQRKKNKEDISAAIAAQKKIGPKIKAAETELREFQESFDNQVLSLPNIPSETVPLGESERDNQELKRWGEIPSFDFEVLSHDDFGEKRGWFDFKQAVEISGARFCVSKGAAAKLERALIQFMLDRHGEQNGYEEVIPPFIVNDRSLRGTGNLPKFEEDLFKLQAEHPFYLIPTAEVPLTNLHAQQILDESDLPKYYTAYTPCFRSEAGSYGKDVKGLIRQHQFNKVELVKIVKPETSEQEHEKMRENAEEILELLGLPYRTVVLCTGDMGFAAQKTYDLEVWLPSQRQYREISSVSNCGDFQARRMNCRYRDESNNKHYVHTLNGSGLAVGRTLIAILENYQTKDLKLKVPEILKPYLGGADEL